MAEATLTKEQLQKTRPSLEYYPQMMASTRMLIVDYDVTRMHSFDIFRMLLLDDKLVYHLVPQLHPFLTAETIEEELGYYIRFADSLSPYDNFTNVKDILNLEEYEDLLPDLLNNPIIKVTPTDIMNQFGVIFSRNSITGYLLRYDCDNVEIPWSDKVKVFTSKHILDMRMASALVEQYRINAVMCSSIESAILLRKRLDTINYTEPMTFMVGNYAYNFDPEHLGVMKLSHYMYHYTVTYRDEYGTFSPYANIQLPNRKEETPDDHDPI